MATHTTLRLYEGQMTEADWHSRGQTGYSKTEISQIKDPSYGSTKEVTSIPSPFARIHLFENAFAAVSEQASRDGYKHLDDKSAYHLLVSDALDVAEIFFNFRIFHHPPNRELQIRQWNRRRHLQLLRDNPNHQLLANTLELFLQQDSRASNFHLLENIYLIYCDNVLIGGTSPSTLFFAAHNSHQQLARLQLVQGDDHLFDASPRPLYKRSPQFIKYLYGLFKVSREMNPDAWRTLQQQILDNPEYNMEAFRRQYDEALWEQSAVEILPGFYHRWKKEAAVDYSLEDFALQTTKLQAAPTGLKVPLVLQQGFNKPLQYGGGKWDPNIEVPTVVATPLDQRLLPGRTEKYPWLTVSDLLEPYLIKLPFYMDENRFFNGNREQFNQPDEYRGLPGDDSYLLPLRKEFFQYFDADYLRQRNEEGKPNFRMVRVGADAVRVELRLPIRAGDAITFQRLYRPNAQPDERRNEGAVVECLVTMGFLPMAEPTNPSDIYQHITLVDADTLPHTKQLDYSLNFYRGDGVQVQLQDRDWKVRSRKNEHSHQATSKHYVLREAYTFLELTNGKQSGILVPLRERLSTSRRKTHVAVDFGTTNTHIAIAFDDERTLPFQIEPADQQLFTLHDNRFKLTILPLMEVIASELPPYHIGQQYTCWFPTRTAISELGAINYSQVTPIADMPIAFILERRPIQPAEQQLVTDLKWLRLGDTEEATRNDARIQAFLSELFILIRNKILQNRGDLERTTLVWFYPDSMGAQKISRFDRMWQDLARRYISPKVEVRNFSESLAPYFAHSSNVRKGLQYPVLNVDIGGGTTDVAVFTNDQPNFTTSFRFAGNAVFGDGYEARSQENGFVRKFTPRIVEWLNQAELYNLRSAYHADFKNLGSSDINSFFFSIQDNKEVRDANFKFSYSDFLADNEDARMVFTVFFGAIIYHMAKLLNTLQLDFPRQILFSGRASNIIRLLDANPMLRNAELLAKGIFEEVYGRTYHDAGLEIICRESPKEVTCEGGISMARTNRNFDKHEIDSLVLMGDDQNRLSNEFPHRHHQVQNLTYGQLTPEIRESVTKEVEQFIDLLFKVCRERHLANRLELNSSRFDRYRRALLQDLQNNLLQGLRHRADEVPQENIVSESLFFYPLIGGLYRLTQLVLEE